MFKHFWWMLLLVALFGSGAVGCQSTGGSSSGAPYDSHAGHSH